MPYIRQVDRDSFYEGYTAETPGELNYAITKLLLAYIDKRKLNYQTINDIVGALEGAKLEFYRRAAVPYEDLKIAENGDLY